MKRFKTKKHLPLFKMIFYLIIIIISFLTTINLLNTNHKIDPEKYIKSLLNNGLNNQIQDYTYKKTIDFSKPLSLIEYSLDFNFIKPQNTETITTEYIEKVNTKMEEPLIYIYNTHDEETYNMEFKNVYNISPNVKLASYILQEKLEDLSIPSIVETKSMHSILQEHNWNYSASYLASRILLEETKQIPSLKYFIDLHRDSSKYEKTTLEYNNEKYAKVLFIIGTENENYYPNLTLAEKLNTILENKLPGISRGILKKEGPGVNGVYNQDFSPNSLLIELGGQDNDIIEVANTINILGETIYTYLKEQNI